MFSSRSGRGARLHRRACALRDAEVEHLDLAATADENVGRLDVPMNDAAFVSVRQPSRDGSTDDGDHLGREGGLLLGDRGEAEAVDELEHQVHARLALRECVEEADVGVRQGREHARLALELRRERRVGGDGVLQDLQRDRSFERLFDRLAWARKESLSRAPRECGIRRCSGSSATCPLDPGARSRATPKRPTGHVGRRR